MTSIARALLPFVLIAAAPFAAGAAEGSFALRAGDSVVGVLARCGDRQVFEVELTRGDRLRVNVELADPSAPPVLSVADPAGADVSYAAHVHGNGHALVAALRVTESGIHRVSLLSSAAHELRYELTSSVARRARRVLRLPASGRARAVDVAAGSALRVEARGAAQVLVAAPGAASRELVVGDALAAPRSGFYSFAAIGGDAARVVVTAPAPVAPTRIVFPELPEDGSVRAWYPQAGWIATTPTAPETAPTSSVASAFPASLIELTAGTASSLDPVRASDPALQLGPAAGVGMPIAGAPSLTEIAALAHAVDADDPASGYDLTVDRGILGNVTYRVRFTIDGRAIAMPASLDGRVIMKWTVAGDIASRHAGAWALVFDPVRGVQVLDGWEMRTDAESRTVYSAAHGFALVAGAAGFAQGSLTWSVSDTDGTSTFRRETYDGTSAVRVEIGSNLGAASTTTLELR